MLDGSGTGVSAGVAKVPLAEMGPVPRGVWLNVRDNCDAKGPPVTPPNVPGVHSPSTDKLTNGVPPRFMIEVLAKVPKTLLPKVRLVGLVMSNDSEPKDCKGIPAKTPSPNRAVQLPSVKVVAVVMFPVGEADEGLRR